MAAMNYSLNSGATWVPVPSANLVIDNTLNTFTITVLGGSPSLTYTAGQVKVQDANATGVTAACGQWVVAPFNPISTPTSGTLVFGFQSANPACIGLDSAGNVARMIDIQGTGQYLSIGPTAIPPNNGNNFQYPPPLTVPSGAGVLGGTPVGPLAPYKRLSGVDNTRSLVQMKTTVNSAAFDPGANFFDAGPLGGPNNALIQMFNTSNLTTNSATIVFACLLDTTIAGTQYQGGPIWGQFETTTTIAYISALRWHSGGLQGQLQDNAASVTVNTPSVTQTTSKWMVATLQKSGTTWQIRINQGAWQTTTISATSAWAATGFSYGGSFAPGLNQQSGNCYSILGDFFAYTGALNASDLANVESLVGQSIGVNLIATVPTLQMLTPPWSAATVAVVLTGLYTGTAPTSMQYTTNAGTTWTTAGSITAANGVVTVSIGAQSAQTFAAGSLGLRYTSQPSVVAFAPGKTRITTFNPQSPATAGAALVFCTRVADPTMIVLDGNGLPSTLKDYKTGSSQYLYYGPTSPASTLGASYAYTGTPSGSPTWGHATGADNGQTVPGLTPSPNAAAVPNTLYNFYDAGPVGGPNDALIAFANTTAANTGNWVCVFAAFVPSNSIPTTFFSAGPLWFQYGTPGTTPNYVSTGRIHNGGFSAQYALTTFGTTPAFNTTGPTVPYSTWVVITTQKIGASFQVRIRTSATIPSWTSVAITGTGSTSAITATGFVYGGGTPATPQSIVGQAYPFLGDVFCISNGATALTEADIEGYETLAAASVGLTF